MLTVTPPANLNDGLVAHRTFDSDHYHTAVDNTGNGHDGYIHHADHEEGYIDQSLEFDGWDDYVSVAPMDILADDGLRTDELTISAWINADDFGTSDAHLISKADGTSSDDRGVQYACGDYQQLLDQHQITCSMSRKGNCLDNAVTESFCNAQDGVDPS